MNSSIDDTVENVGKNFGVSRQPTYVSVQRDTRTSLTFQKSYVILAFCMAICTNVTLSGYFVIHQNCHVMTNDFFNNISVLLDILLALFSILAIVCLIFIIKWRWVWMTVSFKPAPRYGQDIEDLDLGVLSRTGTHLQRHSTHLNDNTRTEIEDFYIKTAPN